MKRARDPPATADDNRGPQQTTNSARSSTDDAVTSDPMVLMTDDDENQDTPSLGLDPVSVLTLSRALGVDPVNTPVETLAYSLLAKFKRGKSLLADNILEVWNALPNKHKLRDPNDPQARMFMVGANPRQSQTITQSTDRLPMCTQLLTTYVRQLVPTFNFTSVSLRLNCMREPHRDSRNLGSSLVQLLTHHKKGGHLWIASSDGDVFREVKGHNIPGKIQQIDKAFVFAARSTLHATEPWDTTKEERLVLVAFTPLRSLDLQKQLHRMFAFPAPPDMPPHFQQHRLTTYFPQTPQEIH